MGAGYHAYPEYKSTHLGWLSQIPSHWEVKRLKYLGEAIIGLTYSPDDVVEEYKGVLVLRSSNVQNKQLAFDDNVYVSKNVPQKLVTQKGDILICARNGSRALIGKNAQIDESATGLTFGAFMSIFRSSYNDYLSKVFNSPLFEYQSGSFLTATINQLTTGNLNSFEIPLPSEDERKDITNFLDHETAKIDTLIEKQQQLIKLLKEKRQAVISHAVTKGLNPNAPMRDSGVEWLGEVPEHWVIKKFSHCVSIRNGLVDPKELPYSEYTLIAPNHIESNTGRLISTETAAEQGADSGKYLCKKGEIIYSKIRPALAKLCFSPSDKTICSADMYPVRGFEGLTNVFLFWTLLSAWFTSLVILESDRVAMPKINREKLAEVKLPVPSETEQLMICTEIKEKASIIDALLDKAGESIKLSNERRTALISAAVTGKIDVRNWQALTKNQNKQENAA